MTTSSRFLAAALASLLLPLSAHAAVASLTPQQCATMQKNQVISAANPVKCERLAQVTFRYRDFQGQVHDDGKLVVLDVVAMQVQEIFDALLERGFPLQMAAPLEAYGGDDDASMRANNSSAFNGRAMTGGSAWSKHAYGVAIDINPLQNPYIGQDEQRRTIVLPPAARSNYLVRTPLRAGMAEAVRDIFFAHGFMIWGGYWKQPIDYQHFEIGSRDFIAHLLSLPLASAQQEFAAYGARYSACVSHSTISDLATRRKACAGQSKR